MLTVIDILKRSTEHFQRAGLEKPKVDAEWLLAHGLGCKRLDLFLQFERPLNDAELEPMRAMVRRRAKREPLQYILGETGFHDLQLKVSPGALIPRPETEELVEWLLKTSKASTPVRIVDLGTGSGAIALALAQHLTETEVIATDASAEALDLARENAVHCQLSKRVHFSVSNWLDSVDGSFDWIVSNPPYLTESEWDEAEPEVREFEPKSALVAADEGLADLNQILSQALPRLNAGGMLACETGIAQHPRLAELASELGYARWESQPDLSGRDRFFIAWK